MKKLFSHAAVLAAALFLVSCSSNSYIITGNIADLEGTLYLMNDAREVVDSTVVTDGQFTFTGEYVQPAIYSLRSEGEHPFMVPRIFVEPGKIVVSQAEGEGSGRVSVKGTPANDAQAAYNDARAALMREYRDDATTEERKAEIETEIDEVAETAYKNSKTNYFGAYLLRSEKAYSMDGQEMLDEIAGFPQELQDSKYVIELKDLAERKLATDPGKPYLEVVQNDPDGEQITLSSVVGNPANKYVLLDFWASWCPPCMAEVPYLKAAYDVYKAKGFEIYGVSFDTDGDAWKNCIKDRGLNWVHVSDLKRFDNQAAKDYAIMAIPSNVLINTADGTVVAKQLRGDDLAAKLAELLGE